MLVMMMMMMTMVGGAGGDDEHGVAANVHQVQAVLDDNFDPDSITQECVPVDTGVGPSSRNTNMCRTSRITPHTLHLKRPTVCHMLVRLYSVDAAELWWAGKKMTRDKVSLLLLLLLRVTAPTPLQLLQDFVGRNDKTKIVAKLQKSGAGVCHASRVCVYDACLHDACVSSVVHVWSKPTQPPQVHPHESLSLMRRRRR